jgi:hypothetical protein
MDDRPRDVAHSEQPDGSGSPKRSGSRGAVERLNLYLGIFGGLAAVVTFVKSDSFADIFAVVLPAVGVVWALVAPLAMYVAGSSLFWSITVWVGLVSASILSVATGDWALLRVYGWAGLFFAALYAIPDDPVEDFIAKLRGSREGASQRDRHT